jgi:hypothetical protein
MRKSRPQTANRQSDKDAAWHDEVAAYVYRQIELAEKEGNHLALRYLSTCAHAIEICRQLGIKLNK